MAGSTKTHRSAALRNRAPAISVEDRENQMISMAVSTAEEKMRNGTAPTAIIVHYLKLATVQAKLEKRKIEAEIALLEAKKNQADSSVRLEELYANAIESMTRYGSSINRDDDDE